MRGDGGDQRPGTLHACSAELGLICLALTGDACGPGMSLLWDNAFSVLCSWGWDAFTEEYETYWVCGRMGFCD